MFRTAIIAALSVGISSCTKEPAAPPPEDHAPIGLAAWSLPEVSAALAVGEASSEEFVRAYLARIETIDRAGPTLQSVLIVNPDAMAQAQASDARRKAGQALGPLDGVPVLLKDNIESADPMPTTAGSFALKDNVTGRDAPLVAGLRAQGAVILGKTNLSEWANFRSNDSMSGWSGLGGQTRNPHVLDRNPCGSSSGSAVAVAAALAPAAIGTETNGSISCPASVNGVVGFKPTVGLVAQAGIVPISSSQDAAGPMATSVEGAALLLGAMDSVETDYVATLDARALEGKRIGVARFAQGANPAIIALFDAALKDLEAAGAVLVEIESFEPPDAFFAQSFLVLQHEFKTTLDAYLADAAPAVTARSLDAVIAFNGAQADQELALFGQDILESSARTGGVEAAEYKEALAFIQKAARAEGIDALLSEHQVVAIVAPSSPLAPPVDAINGDVWPQWAGAGYLAAIAGYPHLTVPMGAVRNLPVGLSFIGAKDADAAVLALGYAYEQRTHKRVAPRYLKTATDAPEIAAAIARKTN